LAQRKLCRLPQYYDVAFSWDAGWEVSFFQRLFRRHVPFPVRRVLEPACGTGHYLVALAKAGYRVTGYDTSREMLEFARRRIAARRLRSKTDVLSADMRTAMLRSKFDAAINPINSIGYLLSDDDILGHLRHTARSLRPGGVYVVQLACAWDKVPQADEGWTMERDGMRVHTVWSVDREDRRRKLSYQTAQLEIAGRSRRLVIRDRHVLRLWPHEDLRDLIRESGAFKLVATYDENGKRVPLSSAITGEMGNHYYVLQADSVGAHPRGFGDTMP
jgi:SAM-dependent methyltransferase